MDNIKMRDDDIHSYIRKKRDCEGLPPFTWGMGLRPNFFLNAGRRPA
jgi:hypothetical protein